MYPNSDSLPFKRKNLILLTLGVHWTDLLVSNKKNESEVMLYDLGDQFIKRIVVPSYSLGQNSYHIMKLFTHSGKVHVMGC